MARDIDHIVLQAHTKAAIALAVAECVNNVETTAKSLPGHWDGLSDEQKDAISEEAELRARATIDDLISALGSGGFTRVPAMLDQVNIGKLIVAKLIVPEGTERSDLHALSDAKGAKVTIVLTSHDTFEPPKQKDRDDTQLDLLDGVANAMAAQDAEGEGDDSDDRDLD